MAFFFSPPFFFRGSGFQFASDAARTRGWGDSLGGKAQVHLGQAPGSVFAVSRVGAIFGAVLEGRPGHKAASEASLVVGADGFGFASELSHLPPFRLFFFLEFIASKINRRSVLRTSVGYYASLSAELLADISWRILFFFS